MDLEKALHEIKNLSGLLPICANCKKFRDSSGLWNETEVYVRDNSEAEFSRSFARRVPKNYIQFFYRHNKINRPQGKIPRGRLIEGEVKQL